MTAGKVEAEIFVDADACPVKEEIYRVAARYGLVVHVVSNGGVRVPIDPAIRLQIVGAGFDAADDWIVDAIGPGDIAVTADIPLAARCLDKGAQALGPKGKPFTAASIGNALATRALMDDLRAMGTITGGPAPMAKADRSRFLSALDAAVQAAKRGR